MHLLKIMLVLALIIVGLMSRHHSKPSQHESARAGSVPTAVNKDILQNAERLAETLRQCKQTAHKNQETK